MDLRDPAANSGLEAFIPSTCLAGDMTTSHTGARLYLPLALLGLRSPGTALEGAPCLLLWEAVGQGLWPL